VTDLTIAREIVIDAPAEVVWRTITEPDQITEWFADRVELDLRPGGDGALVFEHRATMEPSTARLVVETVDPPRLFSFRWSHPEGEVPGPANSVLVEFTLTAEGDERTRLRVEETGLDGTSWSDEAKSGYVDDHRHGWEVNIGRLDQLFAARAG
jgi:uncharacterized protein YndB with AHSA1/START domain